MIILGVAIAFLTVACGAWLWLHLTVKEESPFRDIPFDHARHVRLLEHELMIAGHEKDCEPCIKARADRDYQHELEIAKRYAWEANEDIDVKKVLCDLKAARGDYEVIEVTSFGDATVHYLRGLKK